MKKAGDVRSGLFAQQTKLTDEYCEKHARRKSYFPAMDKIVCPNCETEKIALDGQRQAAETYQKEQAAKRRYFLNDYSSLPEDLKNADFNNYIVSTQEEREALDFAKRLADEYIAGAKNNAFFVGRPGTGKSHLSHAVLQNFIEKTEKIGIFVNLVDFMTRINFDNKESFIDRIIKAPLVVLDDLGSELDSKFSQDILYEILDKRVRTIITTNLSGKEIVRRYNNRIYSRLMKGVDKEHFIKLDKIEDKRSMIF